MHTKATELFSMGGVFMTRGAARLQEIGVDLIPLLQRHAAGDWGDLGAADKETNDFALLDGSRILSAYQTPHGRVWIITEADRSATTILLPEEY